MCCKSVCGLGGLLCPPGQGFSFWALFPHDFSKSLVHGSLSPSLTLAPGHSFGSQEAQFLILFLRANFWAQEKS